MTVRDATLEDASRLAQIYDYYVRETIITFEIDPVPVEVMGARVARVQRSGLPWLVIEAHGVIQGFAYAAPFRDRAAYDRTVETTVYLADNAIRSGLGTTIYQALLERIVGTGLHAAIAVIALPNQASVAVHERLGFTHAGTLTEVGHKFDQWIDVGYWQRSLEGGST
ncbi:MAG: phosphinothricin acetyltransferase [Actinobacteria bacterium HGW-Actinobacteria-4]|nr:MAG: phosphinothricin acetyltransferase [Actinobacteria bacterium HGW-Actinobacteria-4]